MDLLNITFFFKVHRLTNAHVHQALSVTMYHYVYKKMYSRELKSIRVHFPPAEIAITYEVLGPISMILGPERSL